jgi:hypothetical protein
MHDHHPTTTDAASTQPGLTSSRLMLSKGVVLGMLASAVLGGLGTWGSVVLHDDGLRRVLLAYLVALAFVLSLSLGSLFFVLIQHLTRAGWAVLIRRPAEVFSMNIVTVALLSLPIVWSVHTGSKSIYPWARVEVSQGAGSQVHSSQVHSGQVHSGQVHSGQVHSGQVHSGHDADPRARLYVHQEFDDLTASKTDWLNPGFFSFRLLLYFVLWTALAAHYYWHSRRMDTQGGLVDTLRMERLSGPGIAVFGLTLTFAAFDLLMSLDPHWYSTIFGVYYFAGCAVGGFTICLLSWLVLERFGQLPTRISPAHFRDLGRLMFAFIFFWGYIAFSQYMLLWYANIPETTRWWAVRGASLADGYRSSWGLLLVALLLGHFIIPFLGLMSRHVKDHRAAMMFWTIWMLAMHYLDLYWLVMPELGFRFIFGLPEISTLLLVGSLYILGAACFSTGLLTIPIGDPRLAVSMDLSDAY